MASVVVLGTGLASRLPAHSHPRVAVSTPSRPSAPRPAPATVPVAARTPRLSMHRRIASYVAGRSGAVGVAVYDNNSRRLVLVHPAMRGRTASIAKVDILETLLHRMHGRLSSGQRSAATEMIEHSDNDAATELFGEAGGDDGIDSYNHALGMRQTRLYGYWSATTSSARDQVTLLRELFRPGRLLAGHARRFQRHLMRHVEADQRWGIGDGVPGTATFGNKNGWSPIDADHDHWAVNSIGWVRAGDGGKGYEIAVMTQHDATEGYGMATIARIARIAWRHAAPTRR